MGFLSKLWVGIGLKDDDFSKGLNRAASKIKSFGAQAGSAIGGLVAKFTSLTAAVAAFGKTLAEAARTIMQFERANSNLAAILGTNKKGITDLTKAAMDLGRKTEFTATQVTELQTELAKLGFNKQQIIDSEEAVLKFASAVGADLASASAFAGAALRAFGYEADRMPDVLDVMAAACTNSALDFGKLSTALPIVASTAKAFGMDIKQVSALLGVLANRGIDAATAATSLRNIFLDAVSANSKLASATGMSLRTYQDVFAALKKLADEGGNLEDIAGAGTVRTATQIAALADSIPDVKALEETFAHAGGTLDKMYNTAVDNATGASRNLASAWEGLMLAFRGADGPIQKVTQALANLLNKLTDIIQSPFWKSDFWEGWKKAVKGAANAATMALSPVAAVLNRVRGFFGKKDKGTDATTDSHDIVFGENDPYFIGPVLPTTSTTPASPDTKTPKVTDQLKADLAEIGAEQEALNAEAREYDALWEKAADDFHKYSDLPPIQPFDNEVIAKAANDFKVVANEIENIDRKARELQQDIDDAFNEAFDNLTDSSFEVGDLISGVLTSAIQGFSDGVQELADSLFQIGEIDASSLTKALLEPLCNLAKQMGEIMMTMATAELAIQKSITNPVALLAAGAALVAIGAAGKAALSKAISGATSGATATTTTGMATAGAPSSAELTVYVKGTVKGSDIILSGQQTTHEWGK